MQPSLNQFFPICNREFIPIRIVKDGSVQAKSVPSLSVDMILSMNISLLEGDVIYQRVFDWIYRVVSCLQYKRRWRVTVDGEFVVKSVWLTCVNSHMAGKHYDSEIRAAFIASMSSVTL